MPTSKLDRLNKLFGDDKRIAKADPGKPHIADLDFLPKLSTTKQAIRHTPPAEEPWKIPEIAQYPETINPQSPSPGRDIDLLANSDDDEYAASFSSKPTVEKPSIKFQRKGERRGGKYQGRPLGRGHLTASADELPKHDIEGNTLTGHFCPLVLVAKFPYKYMVDTDDRVSRHFFAQNRFYERDWHIYYIAPPKSIATKPILLLPLEQVEYLIQQINQAFKMDIVCPPDPFTVSFFDDGTPQPTHLGILCSRDELAQMESSIPTVPDNYGEHLEDLSLDGSGGDLSSMLLNSSANPGGHSMHVARKPTERSFAEFKAKMERIIASTKKNKQAAKQKKMKDQLLRQQDWVKQLKQAQCYFGLRPRATNPPAPHRASGSEQRKRHGQDQPAYGISLHPLDLGKPAPHAFECNPVVVCVDFEAYERDNRRITEVGVSTLDTLDLVGIAPGEGGENWIKHIRSRHFRIWGREHLVNKDFCPGNASNFRFGTSEWVNLDAAAEAVDQCFEYPFSVQFKCKEENGIQRPGFPVLPSRADAQKGPQKRSLIFLGHDIRNELEYLRILGSRVFIPTRSTCLASANEINAHGLDHNESRSTVIESLDTGVLYRVLVNEIQNKSLGKMMLGLGRRALHLHNAGNDARYTLEALVALLLKARVLEDEATLNEKAKTDGLPHALARDTRASWEDEVEQRVNEKSDAMEPEAKGEYRALQKALYTMKITDRSGKEVEVEVEDPWLKAQESDRELSQPPGEKGDRGGQGIGEADAGKTITYRDPAATGGQYQVIGSTEDLDVDEGDAGGLATVAGERAGGKKKGSPRMGWSADLEIGRTPW